MAQIQQFTDCIPEIEFDFGDMQILITFQFKSLTELTAFLTYRNSFELSDFKDLKHTHANNEFKTWLETLIQNAIDNEDMYEDWEFRFCGSEETHEKALQHIIYYEIEPNLDTNFLHY